MRNSPDLSKGFPGIKTYYGLERIIEHLRILPHWKNLSNREDWDFLLGAIYFGFESSEMLRKCETNDYLRSALKRGSSLPDTIEDLSNLHIGDDFASILSLCSSASSMVSDALFFGDGLTERSVVYEKTINEEIGKFCYKHSDVKGCTSSNFETVYL